MVMGLPLCPPDVGEICKTRGVLCSEKVKLQFLFLQEAGMSFTITSTWRRNVNNVNKKYIKERVKNQYYIVIVEWAALRPVYIMRAAVN